MHISADIVQLIKFKWLKIHMHPINEIYLIVYALLIATITCNMDS